MKIERVICTAYQGTMEHPEVFWEERLVRPVDIYPQFQSEGPTFLPRSGPSSYEIKSIFVRIDAEDGTTGRGGPITEEQAFIINKTMGRRSWSDRTHWLRSSCGTSFTGTACTAAKAWK